MGYIGVYSHRFGEHCDDIMEAQAVSLVDFLFPPEGESSQIVSKPFKVISESGVVAYMCFDSPL